MRIRALGAVALIGLCGAGGAQAKGPDLARACGASGCATVRDHGKLFMTYLYVPSRRVVRVWQNQAGPTYAPRGQHPYWRPVNAKGVAALGKAIAGLKPFSAPRAWR